ncbi:insulinase family protein [Pseudomonas umsongensis]|uniref:Insulinase family protein n=1 Tax=Pseudomonas umsongensis TaxID=198618 RepID=A0ABX4DUK7_9PSED|nr:pitrilysin family protein [Pseudomonas umsongensis]OXR31638.1 insulinase family protein [Pseudomonas umsongensis]SDT72776.1 zinc protease [Pseudomonas umsongensis]
MDKFTPFMKGIWLILSGVLMSGQALTAVATTMTAPQKVMLQSLNEPQAQSVARSLPIKGYKTLSGTKVLFIRTPGLPMFDVHVSFAAGSAHTPHQPGLAALTYSLLNEGVDGKDLNAILESFDQLGARLGMGITQDRANFSLRSLSDEAQRVPALALFAQMLGKPSLPEQSLPVAKSQLLHFLDTEDQFHAYQANKALQGLLSPGHGYVQSVYGTRDGLAAITHNQVQDFHRHGYAAGNAMITLVGDLTEDEAQRIGAQISSALPLGPTVATIKAPDSPASPGFLQLQRPTNQAYVRLAQPGVLRASPDYVALQMASQIFTNRLMHELRELRGLTYDVQAGLSTLQAQGIMTIELQTRPEVADGVMTKIKEMSRDFLIHGPTQEELDDTKTRLAGSAPLNSTTNTQIVGQLRDIAVNDLPLSLDFSTEKALALDLASVKNALIRHLDSEQWSTVILGPKADQQPLPAPMESAADGICRETDEIVAS